MKVDEFRGFFAVGLGMLRARQTADAVQSFVKDMVRRPAAFQQGAIGLGLLGDKSVVPTLTAILADPQNKAFAVQSAVADSLGYVGDYRAIAPLTEMVRDEKKELTDTSRAFAVVALGIIGDKDDVPWNAQISSHFNYLGFVETLLDLIWET